MGIMQYNRVDIGDHTGFEYIYAPNATKGIVELWFLSELSKYENIKFTKHASDRLQERGFTNDDIINFFEAKTLKVVWRPDYESNTGLSARITGDLKGIGLITVIIDDDLTTDNELIIRTAYKINHSKDDILMFDEGGELFAQYIEENETGLTMKEKLG